MTKTTGNELSSKPSCRPSPPMPEAFDDLRMSIDRFCLLAGIEALNEMMRADAEALCGPRHARSAGRKGHRWGTTRSEIAYHGGKVKIERPRVRDFAGREMSLTSWELLSEPELLRAWATNLMVINVSTRKYGRAVRLPAEAGGDLLPPPAPWQPNCRYKCPCRCSACRHRSCRRRCSGRSRCRDR